MSIATLTRHGHAHAPVRTAVSIRVKRTSPSREDGLRDMRALIRHFFLAFSGAAAALYALTAAGPGI